MYEVQVVTGPPCFPDPWVTVSLEGINDLGQACGRQGNCAAGFGNTLPIVWTEELGIVVLPLPEGAERGVANDINNVLGSDGFGQVACTLSGTVLGGDKPFLYDDGVWTQITIPPGTVLWESIELNDQTEVVGTMNDPIDGPMQGFHWQDGILTQLEPPIGPDSMASAINRFSDIGGSMGAAIVDSQGFVLSAGKFETIPTLRDATSHEPSGINRWGVVTGVSRIAVMSGSVPRRSWKYQNGSLVELGGFPDTHQNISEGINDPEQIIGSSHAAAGGSGETSYLWQDGELIRLDDFVELPPELSGIAAVKAINNKGQIAGRAGSTGFATSRGIILTPIDRPLGDVNLDCEVDGDDLALVLSEWGPCVERDACLCDMVTNATFQPPPDGVVDGADLAVVLGNWTEQDSNSSRRK